MMLRRFALGCAAAGALAAGLLWLHPADSAINEVTQVAPGVYFHEGDLQGRGHCNNAWVVFEDYVLVVDANFPSGAQLILPKIKALTNKPIRFAFDTHHHGDHAYGNQVWVDNGAIPVAHTGVIDEMKKYETGYYGNKPGRWEEARNRPDVAASKLKPPTLLFPNRMIFDDGKQRVELRYFGVAHTHGDGWAWLPKERILCSGDACVNGPYNYVGDGNIAAWIGTLENAKRLGAAKVVPGHGPVGDGTLLEDQRRYFVTVRDAGRDLFGRYKNPQDAQAQVDSLRARIVRDERIKKYVGDFFPAQVEKAYVEAGGKPFPRMASSGARALHARDHRLTLLDLGPPMEWKEKLASR